VKVIQATLNSLVQALAIKVILKRGKGSGTYRNERGYGATRQVEQQQAHNHCPDSIPPKSFTSNVRKI
jgi:hypothetical protein